MAKRTITADDLTRNEIEGPVVGVSIKLTLTTEGPEGPIVAEFAADEWDVTMLTAECLRGLVESADLTQFVLRMRPFVSAKSADSTIIREWVKRAHPEMKVGEHGRLPAEVMAAYQREVINRVNSADSAASADSVASDK